MSFRGRGDSGGNPNKMDLGEPRKFGGPDNDKPPNREDTDRFGKKTYIYIYSLKIISS